MGILSLVSAAAVTAAAVAPLVAAKAASTTSIPVHKILSAPGGVLTLPDGRQLKATVHATGVCATSAERPTGAARDDNPAANFTVFRQETGPPCTLVDIGGTPTYVGFQAIRISANGFKFTADLTLEDVDATNLEGNQTPQDGWRETMSALGMADGALVRPALSVEQGALVGVKDYAVSLVSLAQVGWTVAGAPNLPMKAVAYDSWTRIENIKDHNAELARGFVSFEEGIDDLLVMYALTQPEAGNDKATTAAFVSAIHVADGCQCGTGPTTTREVVLPSGTPGRCIRKTRSVTPYRCDIMGKLWCETAALDKYVATEGAAAADGTVGCETEASTVQRAVSGYAPDAAFGGTTVAASGTAGSTQVSTTGSVPV